MNILAVFLRIMLGLGQFMGYVLNMNSVRGFTITFSIFLVVYVHMIA